MYTSVLWQGRCLGEDICRPKRSRRAELVLLVAGSENPANWLGDWSVSSRVTIAVVLGGNTGWGRGGGRREEERRGGEWEGREMEAET